ncbi:hypothetical protein GCM10010267_09130 [Streptomyces griseorubens]|nr:hypothetical protein GCM10010267_09130 [Streptomyces griseorubens]
MNGRVTSGFCGVTSASDCAVAQARRRAAVPAHNGGGTTAVAARAARGPPPEDERQEVCGQLPCASSMSRLRCGSGQRNCS